MLIADNGIGDECQHKRTDPEGAIQLDEVRVVNQAGLTREESIV